MANTITSSSVLESFVTRNEAGEITAMDFATFDTLVSELVTKRAEIRATNKKLATAQKDAENEAKAELGKTYFDSLKNGDSFSYTDAKGTTIELLKIETKSKSGATAAGEMVNPPAGAKSTKRYPKFHQLVIPADFVTEETSA